MYVYEIRHCSSFSGQVSQMKKKMKNNVHDFLTKQEYRVISPHIKFALDVEAGIILLRLKSRFS